MGTIGIDTMLKIIKMLNGLFYLYLFVFSILAITLLYFAISDKGLNFSIGYLVILHTLNAILLFFLKVDKVLKCILWIDIPYSVLYIYLLKEGFFITVHAFGVKTAVIGIAPFVLSALLIIFLTYKNLKGQEKTMKAMK